MEMTMLLDHRTYTLRPGTLRKQLELYEQYGFGPQKRFFGEPLAWLVPETGDVNSFVHIWVYEDFADRAKKRTALFKDPEWHVYLEKNAAAGYLIKQESKLMSPAPFAPIKR
ncbi:MAG: NIPSNAP family protein [Xanthobacteraceae bacterium]